MDHWARAIWDHDSCNRGQGRDTESKGRGCKDTFEGVCAPFSELAPLQGACVHCSTVGARGGSAARVRLKECCSIDCRPIHTGPLAVAVGIINCLQSIHNSPKQPIVFCPPTPPTPPPSQGEGQEMLLTSGILTRSIPHLPTLAAAAAGGGGGGAAAASRSRRSRRTCRSFRRRRPRRGGGG